MGDGVHFYRADKSGESGTQEPRWPLAENATIDDNDIRWHEQHEHWECFFGVTVYEGNLIGYSLYWDRMAYVRVCAVRFSGTTISDVFDRTILKEYQVPDGDRSAFVTASYLQFQIYCVQGQIFITSGNFSDVIQTKPSDVYGSPVDCVRGGLLGFGSLSGAYVWNLSLNRFAETGYFDTNSLEHVRQFFAPIGGVEQDIDFEQACWPTPDATTNGTVTIQVLRTGAPGNAPPCGARSYRVTLNHPAAGDFRQNYTPWLQAFHVAYDPIITADGIRPNLRSWSRPINKVMTDISPYHSTTSVELSQVVVQSSGSVVLELTAFNDPFSVAGGDEWDTFITNLWNETPNAGRTVFRELAIRVSFGANWNDGTTQRITSLTGIARSHKTPFGATTGRTISLDLFDQWTRYRVPAVNVYPPWCHRANPGVTPQTWAGAFAQWCWYCGKRPDEIIIDPNLTNDDSNQIEDPGWGYNAPPMLPSPGSMLSDYMIQIMANFKGRFEHDGMGILRFAQMPINYANWTANYLYNWHDNVTVGGKIYTALTTGTTAGTAPVWPTVVGEFVQDGGVIWILRPTITVNTSVLGGGHGQDVSDGSLDSDNTETPTHSLSYSLDPNGVPMTVLIGPPEATPDNPTYYVDYYTPSPPYPWPNYQSFVGATDQGNLLQLATNAWIQRNRYRHQITFNNPTFSYWMLRPGFQFNFVDQRTGGETILMEIATLTVDDAEMLNKSSVTAREFISTVADPGGD
jgi:hypothetical protein